VTIAKKITTTNNSFNFIQGPPLIIFIIYIILTYKCKFYNIENTVISNHKKSANRTFPIDT